ncbi:MAG: NADH-quinone oxidoreductase subunit NuoF [Lentisphaeria bacterium]|nr:NADH-quinone oxidoreductase subunit NuoF [Lentisphaeria bacterium]
MKIKKPSDLTAKVAELRAGLSGKTRLQVSLGTCGIAAGGSPIAAALRKHIAEQGLEKKFEVVDVGCLGLCYCEPMVEVKSAKGKSIIYGHVSEEQIPAIVAAGASKTAEGLEALKTSLYYPEEQAKPKKKVVQTRIALRNSGRINPEKLEDYLLQDGYQALAKVLSDMKPAQVCDELVESGLRGRGGGGFPTGKKWQFAAAQPKGQKYIICNADEGDPGAFMDRAVLEGDPHAVLEAMAIGGYAIGSDTGLIYIRAEYPLAIARLKKAIEQATAAGLLGKNIFGSGFDFNIELKYGAGAFVCGEETALIHSIEGKRGEPTFKPPFPAVRGLWGKPTIVNNVETLANIPAIFRQGAAWFKSIGTPGSPGSKVFALAGKISNVGLVEVPMGIKLRDIIFELGGGIANGREFKAVQTGGPSGGCLTAKNLDTAIDYESLKALGSMMGSGGMIIMDEDTCMVNIARFFLEFTVDESCGKCTPCRIGNKRLFEILDKICAGQGTPEMLDQLEELGNVIKDTSLCGLGQTSPNPVLSTLKNFPEEYKAHIFEHRCPAAVCTSLLNYTINENCIGCGVCARNCPVNCISGSPKVRHHIDQSKCIKCGACMRSCKFAAIDRK